MASKRPQLNVRLADDIYDRLADLAYDRRETPTGLARQAIKVFLKSAEPVDPRPRG